MKKAVLIRSSNVKWARAAVRLLFGVGILFMTGNSTLVTDAFEYQRFPEMAFLSAGALVLCFTIGLFFMFWGLHGLLRLKRNTLTVFYDRNYIYAGKERHDIDSVSNVILIPSLNLPDIFVFKFKNGLEVKFDRDDREYSTVLQWIRDYLPDHLIAMELDEYSPFLGTPKWLRKSS